MARNNKTLIPEARNGLSKFKNEVASELGVQLKDYMVKRMVEQYEKSIQ